MKVEWSALTKEISDFFVEYFMYKLPGLKSNLQVNEPLVELLRFCDVGYTRHAD